MNVLEKLETAMKTKTPPHEATKGRWGWYPCCYETYQKIRLLNYLWLLARKNQAAADRYFAKLPHNRVIRKRNGAVLVKPEPMPEPQNPMLFWRNAEKKDAWMIEDDYRAAKYPCENEVANDIIRLKPARIDELIEIAWLQATNQPIAVAV